MKGVMRVTTIRRNLAADLLQVQLLEATLTRIGSNLNSARRKSKAHSADLAAE
jgi:hypothetical protein